MSREAALQHLLTADESCFDCGTCTSICPVLEQGGLGISCVARYALSGTTDEDVAAALARCGLCGSCSVDCPADLDSHQVMISAREVLATRGLLSYEGYESVYVDQDATIFSAYRDAFGISYDDLMPSSYDTVFFPGCMLATYSPELTRAVHMWLAGQGVHAAISLHCCGSPLESIGLASRARALRRHIANEFRAAGVKRIVTACPGCHEKFAGEFDGIEVMPLPDLLNASGAVHAGEGVVSVHDSCRDRAGVFGDTVRKLLSGHAVVEMEHHGRHTICCGSGGMVSGIDPDLYDSRGRRRLAEFEATGANQLVTACITCSHALSRQARPGEVVNYLELLFGIRIDWDTVRSNQELMWHGEQGVRASEQLSQARCFTGWTSQVPDVAVLSGTLDTAASDVAASVVL